MDAVSCQDDWELCKENVEPLKQGRKMKMLQASLKHSEDTNKRREEMRLEFENELRTCEPDDLLAVYYRYILWLEQSYPDGGQESKLQAVVTSCITNFHESEEYYNDQRLFEIFLKLIKQADTPLELFNYFYEMGFACQIAEFYISWSWQLENAKFFKKADEVLEYGLKNKATPADDLKRAQNELQARVAKHISLGELTETTCDENAEEERKPLNSLSGKVKKGRSLAPVKRVGNAVANSCEPAKQCQENQVNSNKINVYTDENDLLVKDKPTAKVTKKSKNLIDAAKEKENTQKPGKWSENKIKQKEVKKPTTGFEIHTDTAEEEPQEPAQMMQQNDKVLKPHKTSANVPVLEKPDPLRKFMFNLAKLNAGSEEFSFEEIRGRKWMEQNKMKESQERTNKLEEEVAQLRAQVALLLQQNSGKGIKKGSRKCPKENSIPQESSTESSAKSGSNASLSKGALSLVRELWNGTLANNENTEQIDVKNFQPENEKFTIYSDASFCPKAKSKPTKMDAIGSVTRDVNSMVRELWDGTLTTEDIPTQEIKKVSEQLKVFSEMQEDYDIEEVFKKTRENLRPSICDSQLAGELYTIALPKNENEFVHSDFIFTSSTPVPEKVTKRINAKETVQPPTINSRTPANYVGGMTGKLSPIVETSREYNSKSSSSSGTSKSSCTMSCTTTALNSHSRRQKLTRSRYNYH